MHKAMALAMLLAAVGTSGCWRARVVNRDTPTGEKHETTGGIWLWGLVSTESAHVKTAEKCPDGLAQVESEHTFLDGFLGALTLGLYTPVTIRYTCAR
jgi:hypothetical protein